MNAPPSEADFESLLVFLQGSRGFDFTGYKRPSLMRRVQRRMQALDLDSFAAYRDWLEAHDDEFALLFNTVLINVTSFFRDEPAWEYLAKEVVAPLVAAKASAREAVRVWCAGCASGQEAYTVAMLLAEAMGADEFRQRTKVYATDVDEEALAQARLAAYGPKEMESVPAPLRERYFEAANGRWTFRGELRRAVIFGRHDLTADPPISRLDLLVCRNVLMYFNAPTQARVLAKFHYALNGDGRGNGYLFLGRAEMLLTQSTLFRPLELKFRVFAKIPNPGEQARPLPARPVAHNNGGDSMMNDKLRALSLDEAPIARIVVDANGVLALANQRARALFSLNPKDVGRPLSDLEISYRPVELRSLIEQAYAEHRTLTRAAVERRFPDGDTQYLDVVVAPYFDEADKPIGVGVSFLDVTRFTRLQEELRASKEEIQTTNEELQSSNEELETTNEELQSSNEELETMNEELQSTNEELQSVNEELRRRSEELDRANAFLHSVLASLRAAAVVVDRDFNVLVWNHRAEDLWGLRADEVRGRSMLNLDIGLPVGELRAPMRACLAGEAEHRQVTLDAVNRRGKSFRCVVSCMPLVTTAGSREGVILTMDEAA